MCDTMVALGNSTRDGSLLFAKNSDRQPNEPLVPIRIPRKKHPAGAKVRCTYIQIDQAEETYAILLLKPSWMWGAEMGCNEFGLNIGNEAVFTREKCGKEEKLLGMDLLRLALERCKNSDEALELLVQLLGLYGQGGNCGYEKPFTYHNAFLLADPNSAWVLETAGEYWAAEKVKDVRSISNRLSIGRTYDRSHPDLVRHAVEKKWCKNADDFHFARCYTDPLITRFSGAASRQRAAQNMLEQEKGRLDSNTMKRILRSHDPAVEGKQFTRHSLKSICMHGGFIFGDHTTGSYVASLNEKRCTYLITASSTPCLALFKPYWMIENENFTFTEDNEEAAVALWRKRERLHRLILENRIPDLSSYLAERDRLELEFEQMIAAAQNAGDERLRQIMDHALQEEEKLLQKTLKSIPQPEKPGRIRGSLYFRNYWRKQTAGLERPRQRRKTDRRESMFKLNSLTFRVLTFFIITALCLLAGQSKPLPLQAQDKAEEELYFTILHTNDEHGAMIPHSSTADFHPEKPNPAVGGFARLATAVREIKEKKEAAGEPVLLVNSGDFIGGSPFSWLVPAGLAPELTLLQEIGYHAVVIGNHEYDYGTEILTGYLQAAGYPQAHARTVVLAGNAVVPEDHAISRQDLFRRSQIIELDNGLKVGLFGLIGQAALAVAYSTEPLEFTGQVETARELVTALQNQGADLIIALTHAGLEEDRILAQEVPGLDIIVGGHCHTPLYEPVVENGVYIVQAGAQLAYLGRLELAVNPATGQIRVRNGENNQPFLMPVDDRFAPDPHITVLIDQYTAELNSLIQHLSGGRFRHILDTIVMSDFGLPDRPQLQESLFGNFVTDAMRLVTSELTGRRVDIAVQANGSIRGGLVPGSLEHSRGEVTFYDLARLVGLGIGPDGYAGNSIVSAYLTGEEVRRLLEVAVLLAQMMGDNFFLQFSGLRYEYDADNAVLLTVPIADQAVPTALLPGSLGAVTGAELYTGEGTQETGDGYFKPLELGDTELFHVVTDSYILSFLPRVGEMLPALNIELRDAQGIPVPPERLNDLIVRVGGQELKVWQTVVKHAANQPLNAAGFPQMASYYSGTSGRINPVDAFPVIFWPLLIIMLAVAALFMLFYRLLRRRRLRRSS